MTQREPNPAVEVERGADSGLGAGSPARFDAGPAGRVTSFIAHRGSTSPFKQFARRRRFVLEVSSKRGKFASHNALFGDELTRLEKTHRAKWLEDNVESSEIHFVVTFL